LSHKCNDGTADSSICLSNPYQTTLARPPLRSQYERTNRGSPRGSRG
jgi:hypothetical protein